MDNLTHHSIKSRAGFEGEALEQSVGHDKLGMFKERLTCSDWTMIVMRDDLSF